MSEEDPVPQLPRPDAWESSSSGHDFGEVADVLAAHLGIPVAVLSPSAQPFHWSHRVSGDATMAFRSVRYMATLEATLDSGSEFVVQWSRTGQVSFTGPATTIQMPTGTPFVSPNGRSEMRARLTDVELSFIHIDRRFVETVAEELPGDHFVTFDVVAPHSTHALATWRRTVDLVASVMFAGSQPAPELLRGEMSRLIAVTMLSSFPYQSIPRTSGTEGIEPSGVRMALEFVHHNAHTAIGAQDIARASGLSIRALRQALHRHRATTPTALLRGVRLERAHTELRGADQTTTTVSVIARRWGFLHLGRFAADYRRAYGRNPGETLRLPPSSPSA